MNTVLDAVRQFIRHHQLVRPDGATRVVAAVSGGSDSVALLHLLAALDASGVLRLSGVAHFNHQLRASADRDEQFVADFASALRLPFVADRANVAALARRDHRSIEDAGRAARHEFFARAVKQLNADVMALGHTRDDQAETFLLRLTRGAGMRGLAGMHPQTGVVIRPLLGCRRAALRAWLQEQAIAFIEDDSNADVTIPRNRVRAELLPLLESRFNPAIVDVLADEASLAGEAWDWMSAAAQAVTQAATREPGALDVAILRQAPVALRRLAIWEALNAGRSVSFAHVEAVLRLMEAGNGGGVDVPGQRVDLVGDRLVLTNRPRGTKGRWARHGTFYRYPLSIPGEASLPEAQCIVSAEAASATAGNGREGASATVRRDLFGASLSVRSRRPGDRFSPVGLGGSKKLQDFFVDRKVPRERRDLVPLVVDETDRIVWVAGYGIDEAFRVTDPAQGVIILKLKALGGPA